MWKVIFTLWLLPMLLCHLGAFEPVSVQETGAFIASRVSDNTSGAAAVPECAATMVQRKGFLFHWTPSINTMSAAGAADIVDAVISADGSLLVAAERIGGANRPNSTRLVLINLISGKIVNSFMISRRRLTKLLLIPGQQTKIAAIQQRQRLLDSPETLVVIDLIDGGITQSVTMPAQVVSAVCSESSILFTLENHYFIGQISLARLDKPYRTTLELARPGGLLARSRDGLIIQRCCKGAVEFYEMTANGPMPRDEVALPENFQAEWFVPTGPGNCSAVAAVNNGRAFYIAGGAARQIAERAGCFGGMVPGREEFVMGQSVKDRIIHCSLPDFSKIITIAPGSLRPANRNETLYLFVRSGGSGKEIEMIQMDSRGNLFRIFANRRRSKKQPLLIVNKHGVR